MTDANAAPPALAAGDGLPSRDADIARRTQFVDLRDDDLVRIANVSAVLRAHAARHAAVFFAYLARFPETRVLFANGPLLEEAKRLKQDHLIAMMSGVYDAAYVEQRLRLARIYSDVGLEIGIFLGAYHGLMSSIGSDLMARRDISPEAAFHVFLSLKKVASFDMGIIIDSLLAHRERTIGLQQQAIRELSTPVLRLREGLLILPIIGVVDTHRARLLTEALLQAIRASSAKAVVMDVTGVAAVDSKVANHLAQTVEAAGLMGTQVIVSGISPDVARALVVLGVETSRFETHGDLQSAVDRAERLLGYKVMRRSAAA